MGWGSTSQWDPTSHKIISFQSWGQLHWWTTRSIYLLRVRCCSSNYPITHLLAQVCQTTPLMVHLKKWLRTSSYRETLAKEASLQLLSVWLRDQWGICRTYLVTGWELCTCQCYLLWRKYAYLHYETEANSFYCI